MYRYSVDSDITLGLLELDDADELWALINKNRLHLREWLPWLDSVRCYDDVTTMILNTHEMHRTRTSLQLGIWYRGELCGIICLQDINWLNKNTNIGYWIGEEYQGKGIITKCSTAIIDIAFRELQLNRIEIRCAEENHKSRAVPERLGLTPEGIMRDAEWLYDHYVSHVLYSVLIGEWLSRQE